MALAVIVSFACRLFYLAFICLCFSFTLLFISFATSSPGYVALDHEIGSIVLTVYVALCGVETISFIVDRIANMRSMQGLLHKTSVQRARDQRDTFSALSAAGHKRSRSDDNSDDNSDAASHSTAKIHAHKPTHFQRASHYLPKHSQLTASKITELGLRDENVSEYTQRRIIAATPLATQDPELDLAHATYALPHSVVSNFASVGIRYIYPWQKNCLKGPGLLAGESNLVYCAPTGGGKSLVADCKLARIGTT